MEYRYKSTFKAIATVVDPDESDRFIAKASLLPLKGLLPPDVKPEDNPDMLYFAGNGATGGMMNRNLDAISIETALLINKSAKHKYISTEHDRESVCGVILSAGFSRFGTNEPMSDEEVAQSKEPVNMSLVGALWKVINPMMAKYIQKQGDSTDGSVLSFSWEIAFSEYDIGVGSKNLFDCRVVAQEDPMFGVYNKMLRNNEGTGKNEKGETVFRIIRGEPVILGYSIVANPAAEVKGILPINESNTTLAAPEEPVIAAVEKINDKKIEEKNINPSNARVTSNTRNTMKIEKVEQIETEWTELRKMETAASLVDFVKAIEDGSREYVKRLEDREGALKMAEEAKAAAEKMLAETQTSVAELRKELEEIRAAQEAAAAAQTYQDRMNALEAEFDLDDEDRQLIASDVKDLDDEAFAKYMSKCKKLMGGKAKKKTKATDDKDSDDKGNPFAKKDKEEEKDCKAAEDIKAAVASVVEDDKQTKVVNTTSVEPSLTEQMNEAFADSFKVDGKSIAKKQKK